MCVPWILPPPCDLFLSSAAIWAASFTSWNQHRTWSWHLMNVETYWNMLKLWIAMVWNGMNMYGLVLFQLRFWPVLIYDHLMCLLFVLQNGCYLRTSSQINRLLAYASLADFSGRYHMIISANRAGGSSQGDAKSTEEYWGAVWCSKELPHVKPNEPWESIGNSFNFLNRSSSSAPCTSSCVSVKLLRESSTVSKSRAKRPHIDSHQWL